MVESGSGSGEQFADDMQFQFASPASIRRFQSECISRLLPCVFEGILSDSPSALTNPPAYVSPSMQGEKQSACIRPVSPSHKITKDALTRNESDKEMVTGAEVTFVCKDAKMASQIFSCSDDDEIGYVKEIGIGRVDDGSGILGSDKTRARSVVNLVADSKLSEECPNLILESNYVDRQLGNDFITLGKDK